MNERPVSPQGGLTLTLWGGEAPLLTASPTAPLAAPHPCQAEGTIPAPGLTRPRRREAGGLGGHGLWFPFGFRVKSRPWHETEGHSDGSDQGSLRQAARRGTGRLTGSTWGAVTTRGPGEHGQASGSCSPARGRGSIRQGGGHGHRESEALRRESARRTVCLGSRSPALSLEPPCPPIFQDTKQVEWGQAETSSHAGHS